MRRGRRLGFFYSPRFGLVRVILRVIFGYCLRQLWPSPGSSHNFFACSPVLSTSPMSSPARCYLLRPLSSRTVCLAMESDLIKRNLYSLGALAILAILAVG